MSKMSIATDRCKQCGICIKNCPKEALHFGETFNKGGYKAVLVDEEKCISCGTCYTVCPDVVFEFTEDEGGNA